MQSLLTKFNIKICLKSFADKGLKSYILCFKMNLLLVINSNSINFDIKIQTVNKKYNLKLKKFLIIKKPPRLRRSKIIKIKC